MTFLFKRSRKTKYHLYLDVIGVEGTPLANTTLFAKIRMKHGKFMAQTQRASVVDHKVTWPCASFDTTVSLTIDEIGSINGFKPCFLRISLRRVLGDGKTIRKIGFVDINLSEFARRAKSQFVASVLQNYLLYSYNAKSRTDNAVLQVRIKMVLIDTLDSKINDTDVDASLPPTIQHESPQQVSKLDGHREADKPDAGVSRNRNILPPRTGHRRDLSLDSNLSTTSAASTQSNAVYWTAGHNRTGSSASAIEPSYRNIIGVSTRRQRDEASDRLTYCNRVDPNEVVEQIVKELKLPIPTGTNNDSTALKRLSAPPTSVA